MRLDSGFHGLDSGFQGLDSGFQSPGFRIPKAKKMLDSGFRIPLHGAIKRLKADVSSVNPSSERIRRANARNVSFQSLYGGQSTSSSQLINPKSSIDSACHEQFHYQRTRLLTRTSHKLIKFLRTECQKNLRLLRSEFRDTFDKLQSTYFASTFRQIRHFLRDSAAKLFRELQARQRRKLYSAGEYASLTSAPTRHNNIIILTNLTVLVT